MKSGLNKFFAQITNAFPPSTSWSRQQLILKYLGPDSIPGNSNFLQQTRTAAK
jgi:hypothetical protein